MSPTQFPIGLGLMGMSEFYGAIDDAQSLRTIYRAAELGVTMLDTADIYGFGSNEELLGRALRESPDLRSRVTVATKFGILRKKDDPNYRGISGKPDYVRTACEASLKRLGLETIDLYYIHRIDASVPIEDTIGAMAELKQQGKIQAIGLSEPGPLTLKRAHKVHPIAAVQSEYSLFSRDVEAEAMPLCKELGIRFVPYSPLGRGFLSGTIRSLNDLAADDFRRLQPRYSPENFDKNLLLVDRVVALARARGVTASQLALAWVLAMGRKFGVGMLPIPGTKRIATLEENVAAAALELTADELAALEAASPPGAVAGQRYASMAFVNIESAAQG